MSEETAKENAHRKPGRPVGARSGETREALLDAAHEVMAERGYPRVTVREVAERAGVQPALVNYYFGSKEGLLQAVVVRVAELMRAAILPPALEQETPEERLRSLIRGAVQAIMAVPYGPRLIVEQVLFADSGVIDDFVEDFARPNLQDIRSLLAEGHADGSLRLVDLRFLMPALFGACIFFFLGFPVHRRLFDLREIGPEIADEFTEYTVNLFLHGICTSETAPS
ncbi:MAG: TetR/AcrR family transcriptional regulator [Myxococcota bacterium]